MEPKTVTDRMPQAILCCMLLLLTSGCRTAPAPKPPAAEPPAAETPPEDGLVSQVQGRLSLPAQWTVFGLLDRGRAAPDEAVLRTVPDQLQLGRRTLKATRAEAPGGRFDFAAVFGGAGRDRTGYAFVEFDVAEAGDYTFGFGADWWFQAWIDGELFCETIDTGNVRWPPSITDHMKTVPLTEGRHVLAVRLISGTASSVLAMGGPDDLRKALAADAAKARGEQK